jgi:tetratricopeptide (TPR) repeat protein
MITDNPFPGARAFSRDDQALFFGRDPDIAVVVDLWAANRLTILSGPPGCGKTSLLNAGVYPALREQVSAGRPSPLVPGDLSHGLTFPVPALADHNPYTLALLSAWEPYDMPTRLAGFSVSDFLRDRSRGREGTVYAAIDALDDLVLSPSAGPSWLTWRQDFLAQLAQAIDDHPQLHLLLVTRDEALGLLTRTVGTSTAGRGARHSITGLSRRGAIEAVTKPAQAAGRTITDEAAENLIGNLNAGSHIEPPLLQAACSRLWDKLPTDAGEVSGGAFGKKSGVDFALADWCGQVIAEVAALHDLEPEELRSWLADNINTAMPNAPRRDLLDRHLLTGSNGDYQLLSSRLVKPLQEAPLAVAAPETASGYLRAAEVALARGEIALAWTQAGRALRLLPEQKLRDAVGFLERAETESLLGNVAYRHGEPELALPRYRKASELMQATGNPHNAAYQLAAAGQILLSGDDPGAAIPELRAAADRERNDLSLQTQLALALWQSGDGQGAVLILNSVLDRDGGLAEARRVRGEILADLGDGRKAISDLDHAAFAQSAAGLPSSRAARGLALAETGDHSAAAVEINGALDGARRSGPVLLYAARASDLAGDKASAIERAREAIDAKDPPLSPTHKEVAQALAGLGRR